MADPVRDFKIDEDGEWVVENGDFVKVAGQEAVQQGVRISLGLFLGECFLDDNAGTDYLGKINIKNHDPLVVREILRERIVRVPDVVNVVGSEVNDDGDREASIEFAYDTVYSEEPLTVQVPVP
jgi:hypothetical protein